MSLDIEIDDTPTKIEVARGKINNPEMAKRLNDFSGLRWGNITPTDIDGFVEFSDKAYVFFETKKNGAEIKYGQKLALQRVCDAIEDSGRYSLALILDYEKYNSDGEIDVANSIVREGRYKKKWRTTKNTTAKTLVDKFLRKSGIIK